MPPSGFSSGFDFSAPAVKFVPTNGPGGIPDVELFALRVPGVGLLGVAAAGAFFGLRGLLAAAVLGELGGTVCQALQGYNCGGPPPSLLGKQWCCCCRTAGYLYVRTGGGGAAAGTPTAGGQRAGGGGGGMFMQQQQQQPDDEGFTGGLQQRPTNGPSGSVFRGKGHKLGAN
jgi:hypothetical protein